MIKLNILYKFQKEEELSSWVHYCLVLEFYIELIRLAGKCIPAEGQQERYQYITVSGYLVL